LLLRTRFEEGTTGGKRRKQGTWIPIWKTFQEEEAVCFCTWVRSSQI
jgi:hypothetical protein